ncbi:hypothetical protein MMC16_003170 [Acarospora aff. strigata]|nr:hypothetical protein [Acarospora aff. strigata]
MQSLVLSAALFASSALAHPNLQDRQIDPASISAQFSSAANQLISLYIPQSLAVPFGIAVQSAASAASVTGDINSIVESALTAATPPPFLTALPTQYSSNLVSLESAISALRGVASTGISGAPRVTTVTDTAGSTYTSTMPGSAAAAATVITTTDSAGSTYTSTSTSAAPVLVLTTTNSAGSTYVTTTSGAVLTTTDSAGSTVTSTSSPVLVVTTTDTAGSTVTSTQSASSSSSSSEQSSSTPPPSSSSAAPSSSSGLAAPTKVPLAAAGAGAVGLLGLLAAL